MHLGSGPAGGSEGKDDRELVRTRGVTRPRDGRDNAALGESLHKLVRLVEAQAKGSAARSSSSTRSGGCATAPRRACRASTSRSIDGREVGPRAGSCGTAVFTGEEVVTTDIATDPHWDDYRHLALPHGLRACWSTPILSPRGRVLGAFALYYVEPRGPTRDERELVGLATHVAAIAIDGKRREEALRASEAKYRDLYTKTPAMLHSIDRDGRLLASASGGSRRSATRRPRCSGIARRSS